MLCHPLLIMAQVVDGETASDAATRCDAASLLLARFAYAVQWVVGQRRMVMLEKK